MLDLKNHIENVFGVRQFHMINSHNEFLSDKEDVRLLSRYEKVTLVPLVPNNLSNGNSTGLNLENATVNTEENCEVPHTSRKNKRKPGENYNSFRWNESLQLSTSSTVNGEPIASTSSPLYSFVRNSSRTSNLGKKINYYETLSTPERKLRKEKMEPSQNTKRANKEFYTVLDNVIVRSASRNTNESSQESFDRSPILIQTVTNHEKLERGMKLVETVTSKQEPIDLS